MYLATNVLSLQVAIIAGNFDLAEIIKVHKSSDVGKLNWDASAERRRAEVEESLKKAEILNRKTLPSSEDRRECSAVSQKTLTTHSVHQRRQLTHVSEFKSRLLYHLFKIWLKKGFHSLLSVCNGSIFYTRGW